MALFHGARDCAILAGACLEYQVVEVFSRRWLIGRHHYYVKPVNRIKLFFGRERGTCHAGEALIHAEEILERNGRVGARLLFNLHSFFGFYRLMQAL